MFFLLMVVFTLFVRAHVLNGVRYTRTSPTVMFALGDVGIRACAILVGISVLVGLRAVVGGVVGLVVVMSPGFGGVVIRVYVIRVFR